MWAGSPHSPTSSPRHSRPSWSSPTTTCGPSSVALGRRPPARPAPRPGGAGEVLQQQRHGRRPAPRGGAARRRGRSRRRWVAAGVPVAAVALERRVQGLEDLELARARRPALEGPRDVGPADAGLDPVLLLARPQRPQAERRTRSCGTARTPRPRSRSAGGQAGTGAAFGWGGRGRPGRRRAWAEALLPAHLGLRDERARPAAARAPRRACTGGAPDTCRSSRATPSAPWTRGAQVHDVGAVGRGPDLGRRRQRGGP